MPRKKYDILSPDGFSIQFQGYFPSIKKAKEQFAIWLKRFEGQGYYSSASYGRIPLNEVEQYCTLIEI